MIKALWQLHASAISVQTEAGMPVAGAQEIEGGTVIGSRFQVESYLGAGALGHVYRAVDQKTQRPVALRFLSNGVCQDAAVLERIRAQIQIASKLQHKNIIRMFGLGMEGEQHYVVMEYVEGQSLRNLLDKKKASHNTFSLKGAYNVVAHLCNALHHAHSSLVHGLPGPRSILVSTVGRVKLGEFGIYSSLGADTEVLGQLGDLYCLAPEMRTAPSAATPAADVFSVGVLLFELLTGQPPAPGVTLPSQVVSDLGDEVDEVVGRALQPVPADRYPDIRQLKAAFYAAISSSVDAPLSALPSTPGPGGDSGSWVESPTPPPVPVEEPGLPPVKPAPAVAGVPAPATPAAGGGDPFQIAPTAGAGGAAAMAGAPAVATNSAQRRLSMEELLAETTDDDTERWLVQKDRLDFGPFSLGELKQQLHKQEFSPNEMVLNKETGDVIRIRNHPDLREFIIHLESHFAHQQADQIEVQRMDKEKRRRTLTLLAVAMALIILGACGAVVAWLMTKDPTIVVQEKEKIVVKETGIKEEDIKKLLANLRISTLKVEKKKKRRRRRSKRNRNKKTTKGGQEVTYLGDATKAGGDERLSERQVNKVVQANFHKLVTCFYKARRIDPSVRGMNINFGIGGNGRVRTATVNGLSSGKLRTCVFTKLKTFKFPEFDGNLTPASFSMGLK